MAGGWGRVRWRWAGWGSVDNSTHTSKQQIRSTDATKTGGKESRDKVTHGHPFICIMLFFFAVAHFQYIK